MKYVPVMKWKRGERVAIRHINDKTKDHCKPVFNIMRKTIPEDYAYQIQRDWGESRPFYLNYHPTFIPDNDFSETNFLKEFIEEVPKHNINPTPVITSNKTKKFIEIINNYSEIFNNHAAIKISLSEFDNLSEILKSIITNINIEVNNLDLIIDLEQITLPKGSLNTLTSIIDSIINEFELNKYNSMIITGSSFPETLSGIQAWSIIKNPRKEFIIWQELREKYPDLIFGDYVSI